MGFRAEWVISTGGKRVLEVQGRRGGLIGARLWIFQKGVAGYEVDDLYALELDQPLKTAFHPAGFDAATLELIAHGLRRMRLEGKPRGYANAIIDTLLAERDREAAERDRMLGLTDEEITRALESLHLDILRVRRRSSFDSRVCTYVAKELSDLCLKRDCLEAERDRRAGLSGHARMVEHGRRAEIRKQDANQGMVG